MGDGVPAVAQELNHTLVEKEVWVWTFGYRRSNAINWEFLCPFQGGRESKGLAAARSEVGGGGLNPTWAFAVEEPLLLGGVLPFPVFVRFEPKSKGSDQSSMVGVMVEECVREPLAPNCPPFVWRT